MAPLTTRTSTRRSRRICQSVPSEGEITNDTIPIPGVARFISAKSIVNNTGLDLFIRDRDNVTHRIPNRTPDPALRRGIYYTTGYFSDKGVEFDVKREVSNDLNSRRTHISQRVEPRGVYGSALRMTDFTKHYFVDYQDMITQGGVIYLREIDTLVSIGELSEMPDHISLDASYFDVFEEMTEQLETNATGYMLGVVDNTDTFGERYVNLNGDVQRVCPIKNILRQNGLYLFRKNLSDHNKNEVEFYDLAKLIEGKCPVKFHSTQAEAEAFGSAQQQREREWEVKKTRLEQEITEKKAEFEVKSIERKDFYEDKSYGRKDDSENLKTFVTSVGIVGGLFTLISKMTDIFKPAKLFSTSLSLVGKWFGF